MDRNAMGYLTDLNRTMDTALALLEKLAAYPELKNEDFIVYQAYLREYLADTNLMVLDALEVAEQEAMLKANRDRVRWEKKIRDPNDCYLEVKRREEELRKEGKPSQIGLLLGMRRVTREEIMSSTFEEDDEVGPDVEERT
ncbi:MAG TPA: hypothetical protein VFU86_02140 [Terriglobales bacterium]|nr:hypothetical protein [Terriglobales bacterium]